MQALSNKYGMPIKIVSITDFNDPNPKVERIEPDGDFEVKEKIEEMIHLNTGRVHFDLISKKKKSIKEPTLSPLESPPVRVLSPSSLSMFPEKLLSTRKNNVYFDVTNNEMQNSKYAEKRQTENQELFDLKLELAESKREINSLKELLQIKTTKSSSEQNSNDISHSCVECGNIFNEVNSLQDHIRKVHQPAKTFECKTCGTLYSNKEHLKAHIVFNHVKKFDCDSCE